MHLKGDKYVALGYVHGFASGTALTEGLGWTCHTLSPQQCMSSAGLMVQSKKEKLIGV
jgi:hypothetical protein